MQINSNISRKIVLFLNLIGVLILISTTFIKIKILPYIGLFTFFVGISIYSYIKTNDAKKFFKFNFIYKVKILLTVFTLIPIVIFFLNWLGFEINSLLFFLIFILSIFISLLLLFLKKSQIDYYKERAVFFKPISNSSIYAIFLSIIIFIFYIQLYWFPEKISNVVKLFNPLSFLLRNKESDQWFLYGSLYSICVLIWGIIFIKKYRNKAYHKWRTISLIISQIVFSYFIPLIVESFNLNNVTDINGKFLGYYSANPMNSWPLNFDFFSSSHLEAYTQESFQPLAQVYLIWGIIFFLVITPILTYFFGKRWYCSWICSCGGLAETIGDSFRHLSDKSIKAWKIERIVIYSVLLFVSIMTISVLYTFISGKEYNLLIWTINKTKIYIILNVVLILSISVCYIFYLKSKRKIFAIIISILISFIILLSFAYISGNNNVFFLKSTYLKKSYGFLIGAIFSGILGVGFYPLLGNRFWCRFGCPMAGYMGLGQRFYSRFQITVNKNQCISCGNCSVYCEQGIDVRSYAQKGEDIKRSSCVGCGICATVCPRGVLKLENIKK